MEVWQEIFYFLRSIANFPVAFVVSEAYDSNGHDIIGEVQHEQSNTGVNR